MSKLINNYLPELYALMIHRPAPGMVTVNVTNICNQNCIYCEIGMRHPSPGSNALKAEDLKWIIDEMQKTGIPKISLCGGEPFLFEGIIEVIAYAGERNIRCSVTTNGMTAFLLKDEDLKILKKFKTEVNISIDSFDAGIDAFTRGTPSAFERSLKSIEMLSNSLIPVTVLCVITRYNFRHLFDSLLLAYERGIKQVLYQPVNYFSNYPEVSPLPDKKLLNVSADEIPVLLNELKKILDFEKTHDIKTNVYRILPWIAQYLETAATNDGTWFFNKVLRRFFCREVYAIIDISYDGGIQPCGLSPAVVNIYDHREEGLIELWTKATMGIKNDMEKEQYYPYCNSCCHHFSRNMLASLMKYPVTNRAALAGMIPLISRRLFKRLIKSESRAILRRMN